MNLIYYVETIFLVTIGNIQGETDNKKARMIYAGFGVFFTMFIMASFIDRFTLAMRKNNFDPSLR